MRSNKLDHLMGSIMYHLAQEEWKGSEYFTSDDPAPEKVAERKRAQHAVLSEVNGMELGMGILLPGTRHKNYFHWWDVASIGSQYSRPVLFVRIVEKKGKFYPLFQTNDFIKPTTGSLIKNIWKGPWLKIAFDMLCETNNRMGTGQGTLTDRNSSIASGKVQDGTRTITEKVAVTRTEKVPIGFEIKENLPNSYIATPIMSERSYTDYENRSRNVPTYRTEYKTKTTTYLNKYFYFKDLTEEESKRFSLIADRLSKVNELYDSYSKLGIFSFSQKAEIITSIKNLLTYSKFAVYKALIDRCPNFLKNDIEYLDSCIEKKNEDLLKIEKESVGVSRFSPMYSIVAPRIKSCKDEINEYKRIKAHLGGSYKTVQQYFEQVERELKNIEAKFLE